MPNNISHDVAAQVAAKLVEQYRLLINNDQNMQKELGVNQQPIGSDIAAITAAWKSFYNTIISQ